MGGRELCFMTNVSAEVWASVAQTVVAVIAIIVGAAAIIYQVKIQTRQQENRERAALRQRLASFCSVAQTAERILSFAAEYLETSKLDGWLQIDSDNPDRKIVGEVLRAVDLSAIADATHLFEMKHVIHAFNDADVELDDVAMSMGVDVSETKARWWSERVKRHAETMRAYLDALAKERDALVPI